MDGWIIGLMDDEIAVSIIRVFPYLCMIMIFVDLFKQFFCVCAICLFQFKIGTSVLVKVRRKVFEDASIGIQSVFSGV